MEAKTKLMPVLQVGPRKQEVANLVVHSLAAMLAPGCVPAFTSDGLNLYYYGAPCKRHNSMRAGMPDNCLPKVQLRTWWQACGKSMSRV